MLSLDVIIQGQAMCILKRCMHVEFNSITVVCLLTPINNLYAVGVNEPSFYHYSSI